MDSKPFESFDVLARIGHAVAGGNLACAAALAASLRNAPAPPGPELGDYLDRLRATLIAARAWRAHAGASLARLTAAAEFGKSAADDPHRHNFVVAANR